MKTLKRFVQAYNVFLFSFYLLSLHWKCTISLWMVCACAVCTKGETTCRHRPWWLFHFRIIFFPRYALFVFNLLFHSFAFFYFFLFDFRASATWNCKACIRCQQLTYLMLCTVESRTTLLSTNHHWSIVSKISRGSKRHCIIINSLWEWKKKPATLSMLLLLVNVAPCDRICSAHNRRANLLVFFFYLSFLFFVVQSCYAKFTAHTS